MRPTALIVLSLLISAVFTTCGTRSGSDKYYEEFRDQTLYPVKMEGKFGYINKDGVLVVPATFKAAYAFREGRGYFETKDSMGFVDSKGKIVFKGEKIRINKSGWTYVFYVLLYGIDIFGDSFYSEGLAHVIRNGKWGYINKEGEVVIPETYERANPFQEEVAAVQQNERWGFIDRKGVFVISSIYKKAGSFTEGLAMVATDSLYGYINHEGEVVIAEQFTRATPFSEGLAGVKTKDNKYAFINNKGEIVKEVGPGCELIFSEGMVAFRKDTLWGFMNRNFDTIVPPRYDNVLRFTEGLAAVRTNNRLCGYIDKTGKEVIAPQYDNAMIFYYDLAFVKTAGGNRTKAYIDKKGNYVWKQPEE